MIRARVAVATAVSGLRERGLGGRSAWLGGGPEVTGGGTTCCRGLLQGFDRSEMTVVAASHIVYAVLALLADQMADSGSLDSVDHATSALPSARGGREVVRTVLARRSVSPYIAAAIQRSAFLGDKAANIEQLVGVCEESFDERSKLVALPEMGTTGYTWERRSEIMAFAETVPESTTDCFSKLASSRGAWIRVGLRLGAAPVNDPYPRVGRGFRPMPCPSQLEQLLACICQRVSHPHVAVIRERAGHWCIRTGPLRDLRGEGVVRPLRALVTYLDLLSVEAEHHRQIGRDRLLLHRRRSELYINVVKTMPKCHMSVFVDGMTLCT